MRRSARAAAMVLPLFLTALSAPRPAPIDLPGAHAHPESLSIAPDGMAYVSSAYGGVLRVSLASGEIVQWIKPGDYGSSSTFGVLVDAPRNMLWVCTNNIAAMGVTVPGADEGAWLKGFDLETGAGKQRYQLPGDKSLCNDIAAASDGTLYVTETSGSRILRLRPGAAALEEWGHDPAYAAPDGSGLDGIAIGGDGQLYVNNIRSHALVRVAIAADGAPGKATTLETSRAFASPDGLRPLGGMRFVEAEGGGKIAIVTVEGDKADVQTLTEGLSSPTGVDAHDGSIWYVQGEFGYIFNPQLRGKTPPPFKLAPVSASY